jgi:hypothetical protein
MLRIIHFLLDKIIKICIILYHEADPDKDPDDEGGGKPGGYQSEAWSQSLLRQPSNMRPALNAARQEGHCFIRRQVGSEALALRALKKGCLTQYKFFCPKSIAIL